MRRIVVAAMSTLSGLVLLFSYHTSTSSDAAASGAEAPVAASGGATSGAATSSTSQAAAPSTSSASAAASSSTSSTSSSSGTFTGETVMTRWGAVQVQITVANGKITKAEAVQYPQENGRDQEINAYAVPTLNAEAVQQQSASIDAVSGATVTSDGYVQSLQFAIDAAQL